MIIHVSDDEQEKHTYMLQAFPDEQISSLLDEAVQTYNRRLGPGKQRAISKNYILKVHNYIGNSE